MAQTKDLSGRNLITYRFGNSQILASPYFLYEVSVDKYWKNGFCNLKNRYFKSDKFLKINHTVEIKHCGEYNIVRSISLLGAPYNFIKERNMPIYTKNGKCRKRVK